MVAKEGREDEWSVPLDSQGHSSGGFKDMLRPKRPMLRHLGARYNSSKAARLPAQPRQPGGSFRPRNAAGGASSTRPLPSVPLVSVHPLTIVADAFFAGDKPLLELNVPLSERQDSSKPSEERQSLDEMLDQAMQWYEPSSRPQTETTPASSQTSSLEAERQISRSTPFVPPSQQSKHNSQQAKADRRRKLAAHHRDQTEQFLKAMHRRLHHSSADARLALDNLFASGQKLAELLPESSTQEKAKTLTAQDVKELIDITAAAMEHWSSENGPPRLFTMEKDPDTGVWSTAENKAAEPSCETQHDRVAPFEELDDVSESHVIVLDETGHRQVFSSDNASPQPTRQPHSLSAAITHFIRSLPNEQQDALDHDTANRLGKRQPGVGRRIPLGPRIIALPGGRSVPRVRRSPQQLLGWTGTVHADSVKKKRRKKVRPFHCPILKTLD